ncbi:lipid particle protein [Rhodotorula toruloides]|uniref:Lipid particle protein n=1 Tax=Rhodotorula toruloides TaxID=5286 RepID=A0A511KPH1_RHOTO|nr:lipid particle protein [Rhodotorula toruloides]
MLAPRPVHLVTVLHGLWGSPTHIAYVVDSVTRHASRPSALRSRARESSPSRAAETDVEVVVLAPRTNAESFAHTYDGIDVCADRVVDEIDAEVRRIEDDGGRVERFSIVGYSLGGLVARYVLGLLNSRTPSFFSTVRPVNFTTFASPALGIPQYKSFWSRTFRFLGSRLLSRTGNQLYERDRFLPARFNSGKDDGVKDRKGLSRYLPVVKGREEAEPLLKVLADPRYSFYKALARFEKIDVFANAVNDRTVPFPTGGIEAHDPFGLARAKAKKLADARGDDPDVQPDIREGGLEITLEPDAPIISSYRTLPSPPSSTTTATSSSKRRFRFRLPFLLRPTSYPFSRPVSLAIIAFLPLALPLSVLYLISRFALQGRESRRRIRNARERLGEGREGMLRRVGVGVAEVVEQVGVDNPEYVEGLNGAEEEGRGEGPQRTFGSGGGTETPALARPVSPPSLASSPARSPSPPATSSPAGSDTPLVPGPPANAAHYSTDPILSSSQLFQLNNLNSLPGLKKHLVYLPHARNAHGAIVRRDPNLAMHREGKKVVDWWARQFLV